MIFSVTEKGGGEQSFSTKPCELVTSQFSRKRIGQGLRCCRKWCKVCQQNSDASQDALALVHNSSFEAQHAKDSEYDNMYRAKVDRLAGKTDFLQKKGLKIACLGATRFRSCHFGGSWRPNRLRQVNFWGTPEMFGT